MLFPRVFTSRHPWTKKSLSDQPSHPLKCEWADIQGQAEELKIPLRVLQNLSIPLENLSHITHDRNADAILHDTNYPSSYVFKPKEKTGKSYEEDGRPLGESYEALPNDRYRHFLPGRQVLPGYYCWWGVHNVTQTRVDVKEAIQKLGRKAHVVNYLKIQPTSHYGNHEFYGSFENILYFYSKSRRSIPTDIYLKVGGTLRYRYEICYVIIVCTQNDLIALIGFPNIHPRESHPFDSNGLVDRDGRITNPKAVPKFRPQFTVNYMKKNLSWENIAFAFYFPTQEDQYLVCHRSMISHKEIKHTRCISTQPVRGQGEKKIWKCPNDL